MKIVNQFIIVFILSINISAKAQSTDENAILNVLLNQVKGWNDGKIEAYMQGYWQSDSLLFFGPSGVTKGWNKALDNYKQSYPDTFTMGKLTYDLVEMKRLTASDYLVAGKWFLLRKKNSTGGTFSLIFRKIKNDWVIVIDHSS